MPIVSIEGEDRSFEVSEKSIIFDALETQNFELPHGCLAGSCGACRIEVLEGANNLSEPSFIEENTIRAIRQNYERIHGKGALDGKIVRLACRAKVLGDVRIRPLR